MKLPRRNFLHLAAGAAVVPAMARSAWGQAYPTRPVKIIVAFAAGGPTDLFARVFAQKLQEQTGKSFYIERMSAARAATPAPPGRRNPRRTATQFL
jgi:tripartite-type tricarboxylate transporter receptor subunit TctC